MKIPLVHEKTVQAATLFSRSLVGRRGAFDEAVRGHDELLARHCFSSRVQSSDPLLTLMSHAITFETLRLACVENGITIPKTDAVLFGVMEKERASIDSIAFTLQRMLSAQQTMCCKLRWWANGSTVALAAIAEIYRVFELLPDPPQPV